MDKPNIFDILPDDSGDPMEAHSQADAHNFSYDAGENHHEGHNEPERAEADAGEMNYADPFTGGETLGGDGDHDEGAGPSNSDDDLQGEGGDSVAGADHDPRGGDIPVSSQNEPPAKRGFSTAQKVLFGGVGFLALVVAMTGLNSMGGSKPAASQMPSIARTGLQGAAPGDVAPVARSSDQALSLPGQAVNPSVQQAQSALPPSVPAPAAPVTIPEVGTWSAKAAEAINTLNSGQAGFQEDNMRAFLTDDGATSWLNALDSAGINKALVSGKLASVSFVTNGGPPLVTDLGNDSWVALVHGIQTFTYNEASGPPGIVNVGITLRLTIRADSAHKAPGLGIESVVATPDQPGVGAAQAATGSASAQDQSQVKAVIQPHQVATGADAPAGAGSAVIATSSMPAASGDNSGQAAKGVSAVADGAGGGSDATKVSPKATAAPLDVTPPPQAGGGVIPPASATALQLASPVGSANQPTISPAQATALNNELARQGAMIDSLAKEIQAQDQSNTALASQVDAAVGALDKITSIQGHGDALGIDNRSILTQYHLVGVSSSADIVQGPNGKITVEAGQIIAGLGKIGKTTPFMASGPSGDYQSWQLATSTGRIIP